MSQESSKIPEQTDPGNDKADPFNGWKAFARALQTAGEWMNEATKELSFEERADGFRALMRALNNQVARFEVDRIKPELTAFNTWRQKFFMDNPDFFYWVADIDADGQYLITGNRGDSVFMSITVYVGKGLKASSEARMTTDELKFDENGRFEVVLSRERPADSGIDWLEMPESGNVVWVRQFYNAVYEDAPGSCGIHPLGNVPTPPVIEPEHFSRRLEKLGPLFEIIAKTLTAGQAGEMDRGNHIREWTQMQGGAVYTEPGIFYHRGAWQLEPGQALVITGKVVAARYWNIQLYSRYLNSLDHRYRSVSLTGNRVKVNPDGTFRLVLSSENPDVANWLDTEGRPFGMFVIRWLQPESTPELPVVRVADTGELGGER
jgi:hypothetical protein